VTQQTRFDRWKIVASIGAALVIAIVVIVGVEGGSPKSTKHSDANTVLQPSDSAQQCATEAETFETAVQAYRATNDGTDPAGADAASIARTLALPGAGGPFLESAVLRHNDANNPPAPGHWYYDTQNHQVVRATGC
jgi:hypothetical protein